MSVNSDSSESQTRAQIYHRLNPPPSAEKAEERLEAIEGVIEEITTRLEFNLPGKFPTQAEYDTWHARAVSAVVHFRTERMFILRWMSKAQISIDTPTSMDPVQRTATVRDRILNLLAEPRFAYTALYSLENMPANDAAAAGRRTELNILMDDIEHAERETKSYALALGMSNEELRTISQLHFRRLVQRVKIEQRLLRDVEAMGQRTKPVSNLLAIIGNAIKQGFVPDEHEMEMYQAILKPVANSQYAPESAE